jgi:hypothetical protein
VSDLDVERADEPGGKPALAVPLWSIGAAAMAWGLLRGRPLLFLLGGAAFFADSRAEPVRRARELLGLPTT